MFRQIYMTFKNKKNEYIQQNILFLGNKLYATHNIKKVKQNPLGEKDTYNKLFKNNKEPNFYGYPIKVLQ